MATGILDIVDVVQSLMENEGAYGTDHGKGSQYLAESKCYYFKQLLVYSSLGVFERECGSCLQVQSLFHGAPKQKRALAGEAVKRKMEASLGELMASVLRWIDSDEYCRPEHAPNTLLDSMSKMADLPSVERMLAEKELVTVGLLDSLTKLLSQTATAQRGDELSFVEVKTSAMSHKLELLQCQAEIETYSTEKTATLKEIKAHLNAAKKNCEQHMLSIQQTIGNFRKLGLEHSRLVKCYSELLGEIENKKWAIAEIELDHNQTPV